EVLLQPPVLLHPDPHVRAAAPVRDREAAEDDRRLLAAPEHLPLFLEEPVPAVRRHEHEEPPGAEVLDARLPLPAPPVALPLRQRYVVPLDEFAVDGERV